MLLARLSSFLLPARRTISPDMAVLHAARLRRALEKGAPTAKLDDHVVEYLAEMFAEYCSEDGEITNEEELAEAWTPYFADASADGADGRGDATAVLERLRRPSVGIKGVEREVPAAEATTQAALHNVSPDNVEGVSAELRPALQRVHGLVEWLERLHLGHCAEAALAWCDEVGAADVEEVVENWEDLCSDLSLRPLERRRVQRACGGTDDKSATPAALRGVSRAAAPPAFAHTAPLATLPSATPAHVVTPPAGVSVAASLYASPRPAQGAATGATGPPAKAGGGSAWKSGALLPMLRKQSQGGSEVFGPPDDPYEILEVLGSGAMATVHRCRRRGEDFAVKAIGLGRCRMHRDFNAILERMHRETAILFSLRHVHVVPLYDVHQTRDKLYLVMELVEGGELYDYIRPPEAMPEHSARYVFWQLASGLMYIHSKGVVHRDLKSENVLVDSRNSRAGLLEVKISDFGHSKLVDDGYSTTLSRVGTPLYWAPEVANSSSSGPGPRGYDERVDLWSLGVLLHLMILGEFAFSSMDPRTEEFVEQLHVQLGNSGRISAAAADLLRGLIRVRPAERLPLTLCQRHPWVALEGGPLSRVLDHCERLERRQHRGRERSVPLPADPTDARQLRRDLQSLTVKYKFPATLVRREVVVCFDADDDDEDPEGGSIAEEGIAEEGGAEEGGAVASRSPWRRRGETDVSEEGKDEERAWDELMRLLERHFPDGAFRAPDRRTLDGPSALPPRPAYADAEDPGGAPLGASRETTTEAAELVAEVADTAEALAEQLLPDATRTTSRGGEPRGTSCVRVLLWVSHHDDTLDLSGHSLDGNGGSASSGRPSYYAHLQATFPAVTGMLSFGKPAILVAEGPLSEVELMLAEVRAYSRWDDVREKEYEVTEGLKEDVASWRIFDSFRRVKTDEVQAIFASLDLQRWYEVLFDTKWRAVRGARR